MSDKPTNPGQLCSSSTTIRGEEHDTFNCALDEGHDGPHKGGGCSWTDAVHFDRGTPSPTDPEEVWVRGELRQSWRDGNAGQQWVAFGHQGLWVRDGDIQRMGQEALGPPIQWTPNADAGDSTGLCMICGEERDGFICAECGKLIEGLTNWTGMSPGDGPRHPHCLPTMTPEQVLRLRDVLTLFLSDLPPEDRPKEPR